MSKEEKNGLIYVCSLIEYIARVTKNKVSDIVKMLGKAEIDRQLYLAEVNHLLSFEQVADEIIEELNITQGQYDTVQYAVLKVKILESLKSEI